jgi:hypothetical protein
MRGLVESEGLLHSLRVDQQAFALNYLDSIDGVSTEFLGHLQSAFDQNLAIEVHWQDSGTGPMGATAAAAVAGTVAVTLSVPNDPGFPS